MANFSYMTSVNLRCVSLRLCKDQQIQCRQMPIIELSITRQLVYDSLIIAEPRIGAVVVKVPRRLGTSPWCAPRRRRTSRLAGTCKAYRGLDSEVQDLRCPSCRRTPCRSYQWQRPASGDLKTNDVLCPLPSVG